MRPIPKKLLNEMLDDPYYRMCCHDGCGELAELEHAIIVAGKQLNEKWAIIPCCPEHNRGALLNKQKNHWYALMRASEEDFAKFPKSSERWKQELKYLNSIYGLRDTVTRTDHIRHGGAFRAAGTQDGLSR